MSVRRKCPLDAHLKHVAFVSITSTLKVESVWVISLYKIEEGWLASGEGKDSPTNRRKAWHGMCDWLTTLYETHLLAVSRLSKPHCYRVTQASKDLPEYPNMASAEHLVLELSNPDLRENALLELSKVKFWIFFFFK